MSAIDIGILAFSMLPFGLHVVLCVGLAYRASLGGVNGLTPEDPVRRHGKAVTETLSTSKLL